MTKQIAVIGSGMAGLATAWLCRSVGCEVTVFEAQRERGMDAHTLDIVSSTGKGWVDVPLRVMSPDAWASVLALAQALGVRTFSLDIPVSCSWLDGSTWLRSRRWRMAGLNMLGVGSWRYLNRQTWTIVRSLAQLRRFTAEDLPRLPSETTLGEVLARESFEPLFVRGLILPLLATICTCREAYLLAWPARPLLTLLDTIMHRRALVRFKQGTRSLVHALSKDLSFCSGSPVRELRREGEKLRVRNSRGDTARFDCVVVATQANQCDFLEGSEFTAEQRILQRFTFDSGRLYVHSDSRLMPSDRRDWVALNYLMDRHLNQSMFTVWVNAVEPSLDQTHPIFQTWSPLIEPRPELTQAVIPMQRAVVTQESLSALKDLDALHQQRGRQLFFCGSWVTPGVPLLESAVRSALALAPHLELQLPAVFASLRPEGKGAESLTRLHGAYP